MNNLETMLFERGYRDPHYGVPIILVLVITLIAIVLTDCWMDVDHYWHDINEWFEDGLIPYKEYGFEYPPFSLVVFLIPRLFSWDLNSFHYSYAIFCMVSYMLMSKAVLDLTKNNQTLKKVSFILLLLIPIFGMKFILTRNDIFAVTSTVLAVWCLVKNHPKIAYVLIAIGAMIKIYPVLLVLPFLVVALSKRDWKSMFECIITVGLTCFFVELPFLIMDPQTAFDYMFYHDDRPIQIESVIATLMYVAYYLGYTDLHNVNSFGSDNIWGELPDIIAPFMNDILLLSLIVLAVGFFYCSFRTSSWNGEKGIHLFVLTSLAVILTFIIFCKVYSAQYMLWVLGLTPLMIWALPENLRKRGLILTILFGIASGVAALFYNSNGIDLLFILFEAIKNIMTVILLVLVIHAIYSVSKYTIAE